MAIAFAPLVVFILAAALGAPGLIDARGEGTPLARLVLTACFVWGIPVGYYAVTRLDEFNTAAERFAWFWGSQAGIVMSLVAVAVAPHAPQLAAFIGGADEDAFAAGVRFTIVLQVAAVVVFVVGWRIAKR
jgi:hypothetical protein